MSAHRETELTPDTPELDVEVRRPGRMRVGVKAHADGVVAFIKNAALAEADRVAESRSEEPSERTQYRQLGGRR